MVAGEKVLIVRPQPADQTPYEVPGLQEPGRTDTDLFPERGSMTELASPDV